MGQNQRVINDAVPVSPYRIVGTFVSRTPFSNETRKIARAVDPEVQDEWSPLQQHDLDHPFVVSVVRSPEVHHRSTPGESCHRPIR
jgi:hypothetical protein